MSSSCSSDISAISFRRWISAANVSALISSSRRVVKTAWWNSRRSSPGNKTHNKLVVQTIAYSIGRISFLSGNNFEPYRLASGQNVKEPARDVRLKSHCPNILQLQSARPIQANNHRPVPTVLPQLPDQDHTRTYNKPLTCNPVLFQQ